MTPAQVTDVALRLAFAAQEHNKSASALAKRLMTLSDDALKRLSPEALRTRMRGDTSIYLGSPGFSMFGHPAGDSVKPTMQQELTAWVRSAMKPKLQNMLGVLREAPGQGDMLAKKKPGSVLARQEARRAMSDYW